MKEEDEEDEEMYEITSVCSLAESLWILYQLPQYNSISNWT
jgi:hypothetical protein